MESLARTLSTKGCSTCKDLARCEKSGSMIIGEHVSASVIQEQFV